MNRVPESDDVEGIGCIDRSSEDPSVRVVSLSDIRYDDIENQSSAAPIVGNPRVILINSSILSFGEKACGLKPMVCDDALHQVVLVFVAAALKATLCFPSKNNKIKH